MKAKKGAASLYVVVFASLLFGIIAIGFISLVVNELQKSTENNLSQTAYDSAQAGVEDAKIALTKYYDCLINGAGDGGTITPAKPNGDNETTCAEILYYVNYDSENLEYCDVVANILNRNGEKIDDGGSKGEVLIKEDYKKTAFDEEITQAYTCVKINTTPNDYRTTLDSTRSIAVVPLRSISGASNIKKLRLSWYSLANGTEYAYTNIGTSGEVSFNSLSESSEANDARIATPPTISVQLLQTAVSFSLNELKETEGQATDRGTIWLIPSNNNQYGEPNYYEEYGINRTKLRKNAFLDSNNRDIPNSGRTVRCFDDSSRVDEFACSVEIELPSPINGERSEDTFLLVVSLPYTQPSTDVMVEMLDSQGVSHQFDNIQISIDSTGRANDIYGRIESRVEFFDVNFPFPEYAMQLGDEGGVSLSKRFIVTYNCWYAKEKGATNACYK